MSLSLSCRAEDPGFIPALRTWSPGMAKEALPGQWIREAFQALAGGRIQSAGVVLLAL